MEIILGFIVVYIILDIIHFALFVFVNLYAGDKFDKEMYLLTLVVGPLVFRSTFNYLMVVIKNKPEIKKREKERMADLNKTS